MAKTHLKEIKNHKAVIVTAALLLTLFVGFVIYVIANNFYAKQNEGVCRTVESQRICSGALLGLSEKDAIELAKKEGFNPVVVQRDGDDIFHTLVGDPFRVSLWVEDNTVTKVEFAK